MKLRYYQQEAIDETLKWLDTQQTHPLIVLPTGSGKTIVFTTIIKQLFEKDPDCRVLILAHRQELISQAKDKLLSVWPCAPCGILAAGLKEFDASSPVVIASRDTLATPKRLEDAGEFDYIIVDEAHHVGLEKASRYQKIFNNFNTTQHYAPKIFGVTATPYRMGQGFIYGLGDEFFGGVSYQIGIPQLIKDGYLCRLSAFKVDDKAVIDASTARVKFKGGDYRESDLEKLAMEDQTMLAIIADWIDKAYSKGRLSTVFFCVTVAHANKMCMLLQAAGIEAAVVTANTPGDERADILEKFDNGVINALCNVAVLTEGWDAPRTDCIALLRPTKSLGLYVQICGRGMRTWGDKQDCLLLDYGENMNRHGCIDRARPNTKPDDEEPKIWICDAVTSAGHPCLAVNDWVDKKCIECGADKPKGAAPPERKEPEIAKDRIAAEGSVLSDEMDGPVNEVEKIKEVEFARAEKKKSKNGNEYLNVEFKLVNEYWPQNMPFMIGMNGAAGILAKKKWKACAVNGTQVPYTIDRGVELINDEGCFDHIQKITVRKEGRYWNVVSVYY
jgi:DNA repair protein RadD